MSGQTLHIERTFQAPAQAVFDAWTSEEVMRRWFHGRARLGDPRGQGRPPPRRRRARGHARPATRASEHGGGGHYTEIDPPNRLVFTWTWDNDDEDRETLIEVDFEEADGRHHRALHPQQPPRPGIGHSPRRRLDHVLRQPRAGTGWLSTVCRRANNRPSPVPRSRTRSASRGACSSRTPSPSTRCGNSSARPR